MVGIYGVIAYSVAERTQEMGIRIALGAGGRDILRLVLGHGLVLAGSGIALGLAGAFALTRLMSSLLISRQRHRPADLCRRPGALRRGGDPGELPAGPPCHARGPGNRPPRRLIGGAGNPACIRLSHGANLRPYLNNKGANSVR